MNLAQNPFPIGDKDRYDLWEMLVRRDTEAFVNQDWGMIEGDFIAEGFIGLDAARLDNPDRWRLGFPDLASYRDLWLKEAQRMAGRADKNTLLAGYYRCTTLRDIEIVGDAAIAHKKFLGEITVSDGEVIALQWQTLYQCRKVSDRWKIAGFIGFLPNPMGNR